MLVLSRKYGEAIVIDRNIRVIFLGMDGLRARIGVEADPSIPVHRQEVLDNMKKEEEQCKQAERS